MCLPWACNKCNAVTHTHSHTRTRAHSPLANMLKCTLKDIRTSPDGMCFGDNFYIQSERPVVYFNCLAVHLCIQRAGALVRDGDLKRRS